MDHLPGADQHHVAGGDVHPGQLGRGVEVPGGDRVAGLEDVEPLRPGHVEEHAPADQGPHQVDAEAARPLGGHGVGRVAVVHAAAVAHVGQGVPVGGALQGEGERVVACADPVGVVAERTVDGEHGVAGVVAAGDDAHLDPLGLRERQAEGVGPPGPHAPRRTPSGLVVDEVERAQLVVLPPASPVADPGGDLGEACGDGHCAGL